MNDRKRRNDPVVDYTISGLTLDDMMKYDLKPEYRINEAEVLAELDKKIAEKENKNKESAKSK